MSNGRLIILVAVAAAVLAAAGCVAYGKGHSRRTQAATDSAPTSAPATQAAEGASSASGKATNRVRNAEQKAMKDSWAAKLGVPFYDEKDTLRGFCVRKACLLLELMFYISLGIFLAEILEVLGVMKYLAIIVWPIIRLGGLGKETAGAFLVSFQSGAIANSMLVASRDDGSIDNRQLYTSVLVVSCLSLFAHLPTYVLPIGSLFGFAATAWLFGVRLAAIVGEIVAILLISNLVIKPWLAKHRQNLSAETSAAPVNPTPKSPSDKPREKFWLTVWKSWLTVWKRSRKTLLRLSLFVVPTFIVLGTAEYCGFFRWLGEDSSLFSLSFLPPQSAAIIPAQAMSLYNGAVAAASFIDDGTLTLKQAVFIILIGSIVTSPIRTLRHALPTYISILGPKMGLVLAILAQVLRMMFLAACVALMWIAWV